MKNLMLLLFCMQGFASLNAQQTDIYEVQNHKGTTAQTILLKNSTLYKLYLKVSATDSILIKTDTLEEVYYGNRKIPQKISLHPIRIEGYANPIYELKWSEDNTISEGETGQEAQLVKYMELWDSENKRPIFKQIIYDKLYGWNRVDNEITQHKNIKVHKKVVVQGNQIVVQDVLKKSNPTKYILSKDLLFIKQN
jgi:hypothetical protein